MADGTAQWHYVIEEPTRILVADDDPILREFASVHLSSPLTIVEAAETGEAAYAKLLANDYDIVLVDIEMPVLDGFGLVERMRAEARLAHVPVIMVTGREDISSIDRAYRSGADSFVSKPVNWRQLAHQIRYVIRAAKSEQAVREARDRAESLSMLKTQLLRAVRHEFRTPLNAIVGYGDVIAKSPDVPAASQAHARAIVGAGRQLGDLLADLITYTDLVADQPEAVDDEFELLPILKEAARSVDFAGVRFEADIRAVPGLAIVCEPAKLKRAVHHLLRNAVQHGGGTRSLAVRRTDDGGVAIEIRDEGAGLTDEARERVEAASLTGAGGRLGIGLPLARLILQQHGGRLAFERDNGGFRAIATLPAARVLTRRKAA